MRILAFGPAAPKIRSPAPIFRSAFNGSTRTTGSTPVISISPPDAAAAARYVPAQILSPAVTWFVGKSFSTPVTVMVPVRSPLIFAPMDRKNPQSSAISGSRAQLRSFVVPDASTAAITAFSVAPTLGYGKRNVVPQNVSAFAISIPPSSSISAPIARSTSR